MSTSREIDFDLKLAEYRINGYAVFEDMLPPETVDRVYAAFLPLLEHVRRRDAEVSRVERGNVRTGLGRLQTTNRYTLTVPWIAPFAAPEIFAHPVMLEFIERYWGDAEFILTCYHSNTPYPGSEYQPWHRDTRLAQEIPHVGLETCPTLSIKFRWSTRRKKTAASSCCRRRSIWPIPTWRRATTTCCGAAGSPPPSAST